MESIDLIRHNLVTSRDHVFTKIEDMRDHVFVRATPQRGPHTLWILGHLTYVEGLVVHRFLRGAGNPHAAWESVFDGDAVSDQVEDFPLFDEVLRACVAARAETLAIVDGLTESDLDARGGFVPEGWEETFGTVRLCLQYCADHWLLHRGNLADARRAAGLDRMWV